MSRGKKNIPKCSMCPNPVRMYFYVNRFKGYTTRCEEHHGYLRKGSENPTWKGGRSKVNGGYIKVLDSRKYHKGGASRYILEHRLVMEKKVGRELKRNEIVHHLNGIRGDNRPGNLEMISVPFGHETWTYPKALQIRIRYLEKILNENHILFH